MFISKSWHDLYKVQVALDHEYQMKLSCPAGRACFPLSPARGLREQMLREWIPITKDLREADFSFEWAYALG
jgi:hypothetical protein